MRRTRQRLVPHKCVRARTRACVRVYMAFARNVIIKLGPSLITDFRNYKLLLEEGATRKYGAESPAREQTCETVFLYFLFVITDIKSHRRKYIYICGRKRRLLFSCNRQKFMFAMLRLRFIRDCKELLSSPLEPSNPLARARAHVSLL